MLAVVLAAGAVGRLDSVGSAHVRAVRSSRHEAAVFATPRPARADPAAYVSGRPAPAATIRHAAVRITATRTANESGHWLAAWTAAPQAPVSGNLSGRGFDDQTLRQIAFSSAGGSEVRARLSNTFGARPLDVGRASVGIQGAGARLAPGSIRALTFAGRASVLIPPGAEVLSDPIRLTVRPLAHIAISLFLPVATGPATEHAQARQVNFVASGNRALAGGPRGFGRQTQSWYFLAGVDVLARARYLGAVVALGDSITDGVGAPLNANARWPNDLTRRLAGLHGSTLAVADAGIGGNRVLNNSGCCGVSAAVRFSRDVAAQSGVRDVILLEGINDIGFSQSHNPDNAPHTNVSALQIVDGYEKIITMAHAAGLRIFGATLTPFRGARYWTPPGEAKREAVNRWITTSGAFDGVIDFARTVAQPGHPERFRPAFDSGDHLHPNAAGYQAMADVINLAMLLRR
ncbi:MAG TPA: SGNH/GDSL hydrolase family protein [Solirubrobacteraceae bacterium]|nr:SGNH/GDSL hydrolase family protein [Solirubrobacteraceae bacterium]